MKEKKEINLALLVFALTTFLWVTSMAFMLGKISKDHKEEIKKLQKKINNYEKLK